MPSRRSDAMAPSNGSDWIKPIASAFAAVALMAGGVWTVGINPLNQQIDKLVAGREKDGDQLARLYTSIQTNDEYKKTVNTELEWIKSDLLQNTTRIGRIDDEQRRRATSVSSIESIEKRIDRLNARNDEQDRRSAPTILDEIKQLRGDLESLRQRLMVPATGAPRP